VSVTYKISVRVSDLVRLQEVINSRTP